MTDKKNNLPERDEKGRIKAGSSGNYKGRPESGGVGKPISPLRRNLTKLRKLEDRALEILELSMLSKEELKQIGGGGYKCNATGKDYSISSVVKAQVDSAKFVVKSIESLTKAATADEIAEMNLRKMVFGQDEGVIDVTPEEDNTPAFRLTVSDNDLKKYETLMEVHKPE